MNEMVRSSIIILQMLNVLYFIVDYVIIEDLTPVCVTPVCAKAMHRN